MAELGLGVISLIGPTYHLYKRCSNLISNIRHLHGDLRRFSDKFDIQRRLYLNEWQILLSFLVEKEVAESMLEQGNAHPRWNEPDFIKAWEANMAQNFDKAIGTINATLRLLESRMENLQISAQPGGVSEAKLSTTPASRRERIRQFGWKAEWGLTGKAACQSLIDTLRTENCDLRILREQYAASHSNHQIPRYRKLEGPTDASEMFAQLLTVREISKALYASLENVAHCQCHLVNLQLKSLDGPTLMSGVRQSSSHASTTRFQFIISKGARPSHPIENCDCTSIIISSEPGDRENGVSPLVESTSSNIRKRKVRFADDEGPDQGFSKTSRRKITPAASTCTDSDEATCSIPANVTFSTDKKTGKRVMNIDLGPEAKRIKVVLDDQPKENAEDTLSGALAAPDPISGTSSPTSETLSAVEVEDLCKLMRTLTPTCKERELIGRMTSRGDTPSLQHMIYRDSHGVFQTSRTSLDTLLSQRGSSIFRVDRLRMCLTLSLSLLFFGSYSKSFFRESWRSHDIFFFNRPTKPGNTFRCELDPYVVPIFTRHSVASQITSADRAPLRITRNEQLFSLAVVLIEIAFGQPLGDIKEPTNVPYIKGDVISEYIKAKRIVDSGVLAQKMDIKFAQLVKRCLYCHFDVNIDHDDLTKREMQEIFYRMVVSQLQDRLAWYTEVNKES